MVITSDLWWHESYSQQALGFLEQLLASGSPSFVGALLTINSSLIQVFEKEWPAWSQVFLPVGPSLGSLVCCCEWLRRCVLWSFPFVVKLSISLCEVDFYSQSDSQGGEESLPRWPSCSSELPEDLDAAGTATGYLQIARFCFVFLPNKSFLNGPLVPNFFLFV